MSRRLTSRSTLAGLKREAKRWLKALRDDDPDVQRDARARLARALPNAPAEPTLRDVQLALAREHGLAGWSALRDAVAAAEAQARADAASDDDTPAPLRALLAAADRGDAAHVAALLDGDPTLASRRGTLPGHTGRRTALHFGVRHEAVVRALLERGADPNVRDEGDDAMPLHFAAENGDLPVIRLLLAHGADPVGDGTFHDVDVLGWATVLGAGRRDVVDELVTNGARWTAPSAVAMGEVAILREIAARDPGALARPLVSPHAGRRPLHLAVVKRQPAALAALLDLGADPDARDAAGMTPLDQAALAGEREMARLLLERGARVALPAAVALERTDDVERLLREAPDCLTPGSRWGTLIVRAAERAPGHVIEALLRHGASVHARDAEATAVDGASGYTALHAAAFHGNVDAARVLLRHGADVNVRESRWCSTPAGWAAYAGHPELRDLILDGRIDPFQAIDFGRAERIPAIVQQSPWLRDRPFREIATCQAGDDPEPWHTPLAWAVARGDAAAARALLEEGAAQVTAPDGRTLVEIARAAGHEPVAALLASYAGYDETPAGRVRRFVKSACPDHDIRGRSAHADARRIAEKLLRAHPELARDGLVTAIVCGDAAAVERALDERPTLVNERLAPKGWTPLLYLCFTRLTDAATNDAAVAIARLLLDRGADPNAFFMAGSSRYTPLVGVAGEGEEDRPPHPSRDALARLLLERGAEPYDTQVVYDIHFHGAVRWFLELIHAHAVRRGRAADWADPDWKMLDMGGYGTGARWHLWVAIEHDDLALAEWCLRHGASPNAAPPRARTLPQGTLLEEALRRGQTAMAELLLRHGATPAAPLDGLDAFVAAAMRLDRDAARAMARAHPEHLASPRALHLAAARDRADVAAFLLDLGVSPDVADPDQGGQRALHVAAYAGALAVAQLLVDRGAAVDPVESNHEGTPLSFAAYAGRTRMVALLGRVSRDVWHLVTTGNVDRLRALLAEAPGLARAASARWGTPLHWLPDDEGQALEAIALLVAHGADPAVRRETDGLTAAEVAARRGMDEAAALLRRAVSQAVSRGERGEPIVPLVTPAQAGGHPST